MEFFKKHIIGRLDKPLMIRYNIVNSDWFSLRIHKFVSSDHNCLHDHPWNFWTLILKGGYWEILEDGNKYWRKQGTFLRRKAEHKHSVQLLNGTFRRYLGDGLREHYNACYPCWSLFFSFRERRKWGFWQGKKWTEWKFFNSENKCD